MDIDKIQEQFNICAEKYDSQRKCFIPCFDDFYKRSVSLLKHYKNDFVNIVDLGAGTGLLTKGNCIKTYSKNWTMTDVLLIWISLSQHLKQ